MEDIIDFIVDQNLDLLALTETWLTGTDRESSIIILAGGHDIKHTRNTKGGGTAIIYRSTLEFKQVSRSKSCESFEAMECCSYGSFMTRLAVIYKFPRTKTSKQFSVEFYLSHLVTFSGRPLVMWASTITLKKPMTNMQPSS